MIYDAWLYSTCVDNISCTVFNLVHVDSLWFPLPGYPTSCVLRILRNLDFHTFGFKLGIWDIKNMKKLSKSKEL